MNKLTAEKCREQFEEWLKSTGQNPPYATKRRYSEIWKASRDALEIALPILEQQERDEWISCTERLPVQYQSNRYVPLTLLLNERTVAQGGFDDGQFWVDGVVMNNVTRWQPMPLPPAQNGEQ